jgi:EmrB/QacA subfamily drug resistance transporter
MANFAKPPCDEGVIRCTTNTLPTINNAGPWVLLATILGSSMAFIDGSVVNVALPVLQRDLNATVTDVQWVIEAYSLFLAALILVGGSLGDRFGRRRIFSIGITIFTLSSIGCGLALNVTMLTFMRALQGIGGALLVPGSLAIISSSFDETRRGRAIGTWSGFTSITSVIGPVLGGWLVQYASWRWVFFINVPLAIIVLTVLLLRVPESRDESGAHRLDWWGTLLTTLGLGAIVYGLIEAGSLGLGHPVVLVALALGVVSLIAFLFVEARVANPMVPLYLFRSRTFSGTNLLTLLLYAATGGITFFLPFNLIQVQGYSATAAGGAFVPFVLIMFSLSRWAGGLINRYGAKLPLIAGPTIAAIGFLLFSIPSIGGSYWTTFFPAVVMLGLGMTITVSPLTTSVMGAVDTRHAGVASGINNAVSRTAGLLAIAVLGIVVLTAFNINLDQHLATLHIPPTVHAAIDAQRTKLAGIAIPTTISSGLQASLKRAIDESYVSSFRLVTFICAGLALASALSAALLVEGKVSLRATSPTNTANTTTQATAD